MKRFRGGFVIKAHRRVCHSTLGLRVIKKKKKKHSAIDTRPGSTCGEQLGTCVVRKVDVRLPGKVNSHSHGARPTCGEQLGTCVVRKVDVRLPGKGDSHSHGARPTCGEQLGTCVGLGGLGFRVKGLEGWFGMSRVQV